MSRPLRKARVAALAAAALLAAATLTFTACGGSGITAEEIGLELKPLANVGLAEEVTRLRQGNPPYGTTIFRVLEAEDIDGVWVAGAERDSPAADAGLGPGDLITAVDGERVTTPEEVDEILDNADAGSSVDFEALYVLSGDATQFLDDWGAKVELPSG